MGVPSMRSAPLTTSSRSLTEISSTQESPSGLGLKGERVAQTPMAVFPPRRGGRTVGCHSPFAGLLALKPQMSHSLSKPSIPRRASRTE